jgi:hypothetical protein
VDQINTAVSMPALGGLGGVIVDSGAKRHTGSSFMHTLKRAITTSGEPSWTSCGSSAGSYMICQFSAVLRRKWREMMFLSLARSARVSAKEFLSLLQCHIMVDQSLPGEVNADKKQKIC